MTDWVAVALELGKRAGRVHELKVILERFEIYSQRIWEDYHAIKQADSTELAMALEQLDADTLAGVLQSMASDFVDSWDNGYAHGSRQYHSTAVDELKAAFAARDMARWMQGD